MYPLEVESTNMSWWSVSIQRDDDRCHILHILGPTACWSKNGRLERNSCIWSADAIWFFTHCQLLSKPLSIRCPWHDTGLLLEWCELYHNDAMAQTKKRLATLPKWRKNGTMGKKVSPSRAHVDVGCFLFLWVVKLLWNVLKRYDEFPALVLVLAIVLWCRWNPDVRSTRWELRLLLDSTAMFHRLGVVFVATWLNVITFSWNYGKIHWADTVWMLQWRSPVLLLWLVHEKDAAVIWHSQILPDTNKRQNQCVLRRRHNPHFTVPFPILARPKVRLYRWICDDMWFRKKCPIGFSDLCCKNFRNLCFKTSAIPNYLTYWHNLGEF